MNATRTAPSAKSPLTLAIERDLVAAAYQRAGLGREWCASGAGLPSFPLDHTVEVLGDKITVSVGIVSPRIVATFASVAEYLAACPTTSEPGLPGWQTEN